MQTMTLESLKVRRERLLAEVAEVEAQIAAYPARAAAAAALQQSCGRLGAHDWEYDGHGHNTSYYKCQKCGEVDER